MESDEEEGSGRADGQNDSEEEEEEESEGAGTLEENGSGGDGMLASSIDQSAVEPGNVVIWPDIAGLNLVQINAAQHTSSEKIVVSVNIGAVGSSVDLFGKDFRRLIPDQDQSSFLNDELVNALSGLLIQMDTRNCEKKENMKPSHILSSFFMEGPQSVASSFRKDDRRDAKTRCLRICRTMKRTSRNPFDLNWLFIPINQHPLHWLSIAANMQKKTIFVLNSTWGSDSGRHYVSCFILFLKCNAEKWKVSFEEAEWTIVLSCLEDHCPCQPSGYDCGLFVVIGFYYIMKGETWDKSVQITES
jgi:Ulp1 family protease